MTKSTSTPAAGPAPIPADEPITEPTAPYAPYPHYAPAPLGAGDERTLGAVTHVSAFFFPFLGPLVSLLVFGGRSRFVAHHAKEQLNLAISAVIYVAVAIAATIATLGIALIAVIPLAIIAPIAAFILTIVATISAARGDYYRFPFILRLIP